MASSLSSSAHSIPSSISSAPSSRSSASTAHSHQARDASSAHPMVLAGCRQLGSILSAAAKIREDEHCSPKEAFRKAVNTSQYGNSEGVKLLMSTLSKIHKLMPSKAERTKMIEAWQNQKIEKNLRSEKRGKAFTEKLARQSNDIRFY